MTKVGRDLWFSRADENSLFGADPGEAEDGGIKNEDGNKGRGLSVILKTSSGPMMND